MRDAGCFRFSGGAGASHAQCLFHAALISRIFVILGRLGITPVTSLVKQVSSTFGMELVFGHHGVAFWIASADFSVQAGVHPCTYYMLGRALDVTMHTWNVITQMNSAKFKCG